MSDLSDLQAIVAEVVAPTPAAPVIELRVTVKIEGDDDGDRGNEPRSPDVHPVRPVRRGCETRKVKR